MFSVKNNILYLILLNGIVQIHSLLEVPAVEDNEIAATEACVRTTANSVFSMLQLKNVKHKARIKEFAAIHNFFASITLQDHDNLKEIARLAKVNNIDNTTQLFITNLNEVLNEDIKSTEATEEDITKLIGTFVKKLENLKQVYRLSTSKFDVNKEVLKYLNRDTDFGNITKGIEKSNYSNDNTTEDSDVEEAFWRPNPSPSGRRVYQGHRVKIDRFPFMASVQFFKKFQCGASIIKSDLVITAASCLQLAWNNRFFRENPSFLSVQVGCNFYEGGDENIPIQEVYFHPEYDPKNLKNNLALMRLRRILKFGAKVKKIKKIDFDRNPWPLPENIGHITIIGWGARTITNIVNNPWINRLSYADLDPYPVGLCQDVYSSEFVSKKNFCAGFFSKGGGACNRDVGGPGVANGILVGVVSFGSPSCGAPDAPTVFTKLGYYADWIENIVDMSSPAKNARTTLRPATLRYDFNNHFLKLTTNVIKPLRTKEFPFGPIKDIDGVQPEVEPLRTVVDDNVMFKEFISTMFNNQEVRDYLDQYDETEDKKAVRLPEQMSETIATTPESETEIETEPLIDRSPKGVASPAPSKHSEIEVRMVTTLEKFEVLPSSEEKPTTPEDLKKYTALDDTEYERKVEQKIAKLIEDIDIQTLLKSDSNETTLLEAAEKIEKETLVELNQSGYTDESSSDEYVVSGVAPSLNESIKMIEGLSIPVLPIKDLTLRQNGTAKVAPVPHIIPNVQVKVAHIKPNVTGKVPRIRHIQPQPVPDADQAHLFTTKSLFSYPKTKHHEALTNKLFLRF